MWSFHEADDGLTGSFQEAVSSVFVIAQFFGIMPIINMEDRSASKLKFKWFAFRTILAAILLLLVTTFAVMTFYVVITESNFDRVSKYYVELMQMKINSDKAACIFYSLTSNRCILRIGLGRAAQFWSARS